jgi:drug/metabolite transporter (DMT)-like permease
VLIIFFTFALFASAILANKVLLTMLSPTMLVGLRMFFAGVILFVYSWKKHDPVFHKIKKDWVLLISIGLFTTFMPALLKAYALSRLETAHFTLLGSVDPFVTALYAYILWREKLSVNKIIGILLGCTGVALSLNLSAIATRACSTNLIVPQIAALGAIVLSRYGWIMVQQQLRANRYPPAQLNSLIMIESGTLALLSLPFVEASTQFAIPAPVWFFALLAYTTIVGNVFAYTLYAYILKHYNATLVSLAGFSIPVFAALYSWLLLKEKITLQFALAASVIFLGLVVFYYDDIKRQNLTQTR